MCIIATICMNSLVSHVHIVDKFLLLIKELTIYIFINIRLDRLFWLLLLLIVWFILKLMSDTQNWMSLLFNFWTFIFIIFLIRTLMIISLMNILGLSFVINFLCLLNWWGDDRWFNRFFHLRWLGITFLWFSRWLISLFKVFIILYLILILFFIILLFLITFWLFFYFPFNERINQLYNIVNTFGISFDYSLSFNF